MRQEKYREPEGYNPPSDAAEMLDRYRKGERFFERAQLQHAVLEELEDVNLSDADLTGAYAKHARFSNVDFTGATCAGMNLDKARLYRCSLARTNLRGASLYFMQVSFVSFFATEMDGALYADCIQARDDDQPRVDAGRMRSRPDAMSCFISYSTQDRLAGTLSEALHRARISTWFMPRSSYFDSFLSENLARAIAMSDTFALVLSNNALNSKWVRNELASALGMHDETDAPKIIVLRTEQTHVPTRGLFSALGRYQVVDCLNPTPCAEELIGLLTVSQRSATGG